MTDIKIVLGRANSRGLFPFSCPAYPAVSGVSRAPLLDACRQLKLLGVAARVKVAVFREGGRDWDLRCGVGWGAERVIEERADRGLRLRKWQPWPK